MNNNKNGFTLVELIAVIIIIAVIFLIAVPSVSSIIENSRKNSYVDIAKTYVDAVRNKITSREYIVPKDGTAYYIPIDYIEVESDLKVSPYGDWATVNQEIKYLAINNDSTGDCTDSSPSNSYGSDRLMVYNSRNSKFLASEKYDKVSLGCLNPNTISDAFVIVYYNNLEDNYKFFFGSRDVTGHSIKPTNIDEITTSSVRADDTKIVDFSRGDSYVVLESQKANPTSGKKYTVDEIKARAVGTNNQVALLIPKRSVTYSVSTYELYEYEATNCFSYETTTVDGATGYKITGYENKCTKSVVIPDKIDEKNVIEIGKNAFTGKQIKTIVIPSGVKKIDDEAFDSHQRTINK